MIDSGRFSSQRSLAIRSLQISRAMPGPRDSADTAHPGAGSGTSWSGPTRWRRLGGQGLGPSGLPACSRRHSCQSSRGISGALSRWRSRAIVSEPGTLQPAPWGHLRRYPLDPSAVTPIKNRRSVRSGVRGRWAGPAMTNDHGGAIRRGPSGKRTLGVTWCQSGPQSEVPPRLREVVGPALQPDDPGPSGQIGSGSGHSVAAHSRTIASSTSSSETVANVLA
jgi:hypothetical protein